MKRWLFARRLGYMKFTVNYGSNSYGCTVELDESVSQPEKDAQPDSYSFFKVDTRFSVLGFISEEQVQTEGVITTVRTELKVDNSVEATKDFTWKSYGKNKKR